MALVLGLFTYSISLCETSTPTPTYHACVWVHIIADDEWDHITRMSHLFCFTIYTWTDEISSSNYPFWSHSCWLPQTTSYSSCIIHVGHFLWQDMHLLLTGGIEKILRTFDLNRPDAPPREIDKSPGSIRTVAWLHGDQTILSSCTDMGGVRFVLFIP